MEFTPDQIARVAKDMGVSSEELARFAALGRKRVYATGDYLFHQSAPRRFFGIVLRGKINLQRGLAGRNVTIACLTEGAMIGETLFVDELAHSVSGLALEETEIWAVDKEAIDQFRIEKPDIFYRMVARRRVFYIKL